MIQKGEIHMSKVIGIDLGTTFSAVAHINDNQTPELIPNETGQRLTPSVILFDEGEFFVGDYAKQNAVAIPEQTVEFVKREMGKSKAEFSREFNGKHYSAEDLAAELLKVLKRDAEGELGTEITDAVITVPAYFNDAERQATIRAGELAGLRVLRILNEPTAAAVAYGLNRRVDAAKVLVFDLGGGTFDVTIMEVAGEAMNMIATNGDHRLGGKDWDDKLIVSMAEQFEREHGVNPLVDLHAYQDIQARAVEAKMQLSSLNRAAIVANYAGKSLRLQLTREAFEAMTADLVERCRSLVEVVLGEAGLTREAIDTVLLVGGSTRLPMIRDMLADHFGQPPDTSINPDEAVATGAAGMGALIQAEQSGARPLLGASPVSGGGLMRISDVCSHSLGMVVLDELGELGSSTIIEKNTPIPCEVSRDTYETTSPNQTEFDVIVVQGDMADPRACPVRDAYEIYDIPPRPAGATRLKVTFQYNASGVIEVAAEDVLSGKALPQRKKLGAIDWDGLIAPHPVARPMDIALVIDCSGSMAGKMHAVKKGAIRFLDAIDPNVHHVGLVTFRSRPKLRSELTQDFTKLRRQIKRLWAFRGSNCDEKAIALARDRVLVNRENEKVLVFIGDGLPNSEAVMMEEVERTKKQGVRIIVVAVFEFKTPEAYEKAKEFFLKRSGEDYEYFKENFELNYADPSNDFLKRVASTPEDYYSVFENEKFEIADESERELEDLRFQLQFEEAFTTIANRLVTESSSGGDG